MPPYTRTPVTTRSNNIVTIILIKTKQQQTKQPVSGLKLIWPLPPYTRTPVTTRSNNIVTIILIKTKQQQQTKQPVSRHTIVFFFLNQTDTKIFPSQVSNNIMITVQRTLSNEAMMLMMYIWIFITIILTLTLTLTLISILGTSAWSIYRISILGTSAWSIYRKCFSNYI